MAEVEALGYLQDEIKKRTKSFDERRKFYRKGAESLTIASAVISALTTILIGVGQIYEIKAVSIAALVTSALLGVITAIDSLYTYRKRWIQNNDTLMQLYELNSQINYQKTLKGNLVQEDIDKFHHCYQDILRQASGSWKEDRSKGDITP